MWRARFEDVTGNTARRYSKRYSDKLWPLLLSVLGCVRCVCVVRLLRVCVVLLALWVGV